MLPNIIRFALPLVATGILQLLYSSADMIVVGRFAGKESLAAVGSTNAMVNFIVGLLMGFSTGASVVISQAYGSRDMDSVHRSVHTTITLSLIFGVFIMALGLIVSRPVLTMMGTPDDVLDMAVLYVRIYFIGMPFNMLYNFASSVLRAVGDSRHPMYYLTFSGIVNVVLNLVTVIVFKMGVAGVALATIISQLISAALVTLCLIRSSGAIHLNIKELRIHPQEAKRIIMIGLPAGLQSGLFDISNIIIQSSINTFGSVAIAGCSAAGTLESFQYCTMNCISQASMTFAGQNYGAGKYKRVRQLLWVCYGILIVSSFVLCVAILAFNKPLLSIYNGDPEVIAYGIQRNRIILTTQFLCGLNDVTASNLRGTGKSFAPMLITVFGICGTRLLYIFTVFPSHHTFYGLFACYPISWAVSLIMMFALYFIASRPKLKKMEEEG